MDPDPGSMGPNPTIYKQDSDPKLCIWSFSNHYNYLQQNFQIGNCNVQINFLSVSQPYALVCIKFLRPFIGAAYLRILPVDKFYNKCYKLCPRSIVYFQQYTHYIKMVNTLCPKQFLCLMHFWLVISTGMKNGNIFNYLIR